MHIGLDKIWGLQDEMLSIWKFIPHTTKHGRCWNWCWFGWIPRMVLGVQIISTIGTAWIPSKAQWDSGQTFRRHEPDGPEEARTSVRGRAMEGHQIVLQNKLTKIKSKLRTNLATEISKPIRSHKQFVHAREATESTIKMKYYQNDRNCFWPVFSSGRLKDSK